MKREEFEQELTGHIIPFWNKLRDDENGGFTGFMDSALNVDKKGEKGVILHSRILWFYSNAYMELKDPALLDMAKHAYEFLTEKCVDKEYGVVFAKSEVTLNGAKAPNGNRDSETNNGDLITDAMLWKVMQNKEGLTVDADHVVAITNGGGIRAAIKPGDVTKKDINTVLPFGNTVAVVYVTGEQLLEALEASTFSTPTAVGGFPQVSGINFTIHTGKAYDKNDATYPESTYYGPKTINRVTIGSINGRLPYMRNP